MDRAYGARVVQVEPRFAEDAPLGYPTDGSSTGGQLATVPKAPWYNAVTEEIRNAIVGGGIRPEKNTLDQLNQSIEARLTKLEEKIEKTLKGVTDRVDKFETFPPGFIIYAGCFINNPNWLLCDGRAVSRSTYASLFRAIGTTWGGGNGSTTFNIPYLLDRVLWGSNWGVGQYIDSGAPPIWGTIGDFNAFDNDTGMVAGLFGVLGRVTTKGLDPVVMMIIGELTSMRPDVLLYMAEQIIFSRLPAGFPYIFTFNRLRKGLF